METYGRPVMEHYAEKERRRGVVHCVRCAGATSAGCLLWGRFFSRDGETLEVISVPVCLPHHAKSLEQWQKGLLREIDGREIVTLSTSRRPL